MHIIKRISFVVAALAAFMVFGCKQFRAPVCENYTQGKSLNPRLIEDFELDPVLIDAIETDSINLIRDYANSNKISLSERDGSSLPECTSLYGSSQSLVLQLSSDRDDEVGLLMEIYHENNKIIALTLGPIMRPI